MSTATEAKTVQPHQWTDGGEHVLILRRIDKDGKSYGGFDKWGKPDELNITVEPEKWDATAQCGDGIHGWPWGWALGDGCDYALIEDRWLVLAAKPEDIVDIGGKCKCRSVTKLYDGHFAGAWAMVNGGHHRLIEAMAASGLPGVASGDYSKAASSGNYSKAASSGDSSTAASSGNYSKAASSGDYSTAASSGNYSKAASSGNYSKAASSGNYSTAASSGNYSKAASSGNYSTAHQTGPSGIAASIGHGGEAMAGENGAMILCYWNESERRYRVVVGYVGENEIKANTRYRLNAAHEFEEVK